MPAPNDVPLTPSSVTAKTTSAAITVSIGCHPVTALVDTEAEYLVMSAASVTKLRKVLTTWDGPQLIIAGAHLMSLISRCTARLEICASAFVASFLVLPNRCQPVILGVDFLQEYGAVIYLRDLFVTFANCVHTD